MVHQTSALGGVRHWAHEWKKLRSSSWS